MDTFVIYLVTLLFLFLFVISLDGCKINVGHSLTSIRKAYAIVIHNTAPAGTILMKVCVAGAVIILGMLAYIRSRILLGTENNFRFVGLVICTYLLLIVSMYFAIGIPLLIFTKIENLIQTIHHHKLSYRFLISIYILFMYSVLFILMRDTMVQHGLVVMIGLLISYYLNMVMLLNISMEPLSCYAKTRMEENKLEWKYPLKVVLGGAIILIILIVLNLFLGVVMVSYLFDGAYVYAGTSTSVSLFDLFYYTIISFTTIGYGEIIPRCIESKAMAIIIAYTSVMCLVIFISSILTLKDKLLK